MDTTKKLSRRDFLRLSAFTAAGAMLAACGGGGAAAPTAAPGAPEATKVPEKPTTTPVPIAPTTPPAATAVPTISAKFKESPDHAAMVADGKLPPVDERLPKNPYTPPHVWLTVGNYGGTIKWATGTGWAQHGFISESQYGHSILRYVKDGLGIGPGLAESWEANADTSEWTFRFREGLKWSDGQPWTVGDITNWWTECVLGEVEGLPEGLTAPDGVPDEMRSGDGSVGSMEMVDDYTLKLSFPAPNPLVADRLAMWVNGQIGPRIQMPWHYVKQFHPKYATDAKAKESFEVLTEKRNYALNPECPTMNGWMLTQFETDIRSIFKANPYYWVVDKEGNQLPYVQTYEITCIQDGEVQKLSHLEGKVDFSWFNPFALGDIKTIKDAEAKSGLRTILWDSGSGTSSIYFFSRDYKDEQLRKIFRDKNFNRALSLAYNRPEVQKSVYFNTGELTTGTMSPKAIEYNFNDEAKARYAEWRDSYVKYDPEAAKALLDESGYKAGADGFRTDPDGKPFKIEITYTSDRGATDEHLLKNQILEKNWQAIGINAVLTPVPPDGWDAGWQGGTYPMTTAWEVGDGPNHLVYPSWVVPNEPSRWSPLQGQWYANRGTEMENAEADVDPWERKPPRRKPEEGSPEEKLQAIFDTSKVEPDVMKRHQLVWDMIKIHVEEGPFFFGTVANTPRICLAKAGLMNVPTKEDLLKEGLGGFGNPWIHPTPAVYDTETFYWDDPSAHS